MKNLSFVILFLCIFPLTVYAEIHSEVLEYKDGELILEGYLAYDDATKTQRPGIIVVHDWMGLGPFVLEKTQQLAKMGYIALGIDIYGKGVRPKDSQEASQQASLYKNDRPLMRQRAQAGFDVLKKYSLTDKTKMAAIGYCFGGTVVLEMARSGLNLAGVVSFHGGLSTPHPEDTQKIKAKVLVLHGADDPFVPQEEVADFQKEMNQANVDWQMIYYSGAVHSFTNPSALDDPSKGAAYQERADQRSWQAMQHLFDEIFK